MQPIQLAAWQHAVKNNSAATAPLVHPNWTQQDGATSTPERITIDSSNSPLEDSPMICSHYNWQCAVQNTGATAPGGLNINAEGKGRGLDAEDVARGPDAEGEGRRSDAPNCGPNDCSGNDPAAHDDLVFSECCITGDGRSHQDAVLRCGHYWSSQVLIDIACSGASLKCPKCRLSVQPSGTISLVGVSSSKRA